LTLDCGGAAFSEVPRAVDARTATNTTILRMIFSLSDC
jgi:hypothetical protein